MQPTHLLRHNCLKADLRDKTFNQQAGAVFVKGVSGEPHMDQFAGVGHSTAPYKMKAIMADGKVFIPDPSYTFKTRKRNRDYSAYPMVFARIKPPKRAIENA